MVPNYPLVLVDCGLLAPCPPGSPANCSVCNNPTCTTEIEYTMAINQGSQGNTAGLWAYNDTIDSSANADLCKSRVQDRVAQATYQQLCVDDVIQLLGGTVTSCLNQMATDCGASASNGYICTTPLVVDVPVFECSDIADQSFNINQTGFVNSFARIRIKSVKPSASPKEMTFALLCRQDMPGTPGGGPFCQTFAGSPNLVR